MSRDDEFTDLLRQQAAWQSKLAARQAEVDRLDGPEDNAALDDALEAVDEAERALWILGEEIYALEEAVAFAEQREDRSDYYRSTL